MRTRRPDAESSSRKAAATRSTSNSSPGAGPIRRLPAAGARPLARRRRSPRLSWPRCRKSSRCSRRAPAACSRVPPSRGIRSSRSSPRLPRRRRAAALEALDALPRLDLVRPTDVPDGFASATHSCVEPCMSRPPAVGGSEPTNDCAGTRRARSSAAARAHHVERSARQGDAAAVAVLREAGEARPKRPASAARWFAGRFASPRTAPRARSGSSCCWPAPQRLPPSAQLR